MNSSRFSFALAMLALVLVAGLVIRQGLLTARVVEAANQADAARWTALAEHYAAQNANRQRAQDAEAARWMALAESYAAQQSNRQRALDAETARWTALAESYALRTSNRQPPLDAANQAAAARQADPGVCAYFDQDINNLRSVYDPAMGITVARSASGVLGVDGGLMGIKDC